MHGSVFSCLILEIESHREVKVELNCAALDRTAECVFDLYIDFRSIESTIAFLEVPFFTCFLKHFP